MNHLPLENPTYRYLKDDFQQWLSILGYGESTVYNLPYHINEFLFYLETNGIQKISHTSEIHFENYYQKLSNRSNRRKGGGLTNSYLNKHRQALCRFAEYIRKNCDVLLPVLSIRSESDECGHPDYLTTKEIKALFRSTENYHHLIGRQNINPTDLEATASRDKAMLVIFYGCGLRRTEGELLDTYDIDFDRRVVHVRHAKGGKQRYVPFTRENGRILREYMYDYRPEILKGKSNRAFFVGQRKVRLQAQSLVHRLRVLQGRSDSESLKNKNLHLHLLRHSIASHLLENGMSLGAISRFLGHSSLDSTQRYTHLIEEEKKDG